MANSGSFDTSKYGGVRGLRFNWWVNSQNIAENYTDIGWNFVGMGSSASTWYYTANGYLNINGARVFTQSSTKVQLKVDTVLASGTTRIYHNADGTKSFSADGGAGIYTYGSYQTGSGSWSLPTIPRQANITSAPDFNDEQNPTIGYSNSAGNSVSSLQACISLTGSADDIKYRDIAKTGSSYTFNLTEAERNVLRNACTTSNSRTVIFFVRTIIGGNTFYSTLTKTLSIVNGNPTFSSSNISYKDNNSTTVGITGNNQHIVRNLSSLVATITSATAKKGASISKYEMTFNGSSKTISVGNTTIGAVNLSSNATLSVKATDSRGNSTTASITVVILNWELPVANITANRVNNYEDDTKLRVQVSISSVNNKNSIQSIKYRYKKSSDTSYSSYVSINNNQEYTIVIDKTYKWDFQVEIKDKFGTKTYSFQVAKGMPILMIDVDLISVGVNCFPTKSKSLEVNGYDFDKLHPINSIIETTDNNNPSSYVSGTWVLLTSNTINGNTIYYWKRTG